MRWSAAYSTALLIGALDHSDAFYMNPGATSRVSSTQLSIGGVGWDNENFLESLGKGDDAISKANEEYDRLKRFGQRPNSGEEDEPAAASEELDSELPGATLSKEQIERIKKQNEEDNGGGEMFKKLLERAQKKDIKRPPPELTKPNIPVTTPAAAASTSGTPGLPDNFSSLSVEQQAALFRELMKQPAEAPFTGAAPVEETTIDGVVKKKEAVRRPGRNRDADAIVNSSDVYLAQLKLDSTTRNLARYAGDDEKANQVFGDPRVKEIKLHVNPFMEEQRKKERDMLETAADEMILPEMFMEQEPEDKTYAGISWKEKMAQKKKKMPGGSAKEEPQAVAAPAAPVAPPKVEEAPKPEPVAQEPVAAAKVSAPPPPVSAPAPAPPAVEAPAPPVAEEKESEMKDPEEMRKDIRTLMGLLLKHRGGPGFGAGRIQGAEMNNFLKLSSSIVSTLKQEAMMYPQPESFEPVEIKQQVQAQAPAPQPAAPAPQPAAPAAAAPQAPPQPQEAGGAIAQAHRIPAGDRINSMIACIEGAITMYKNCPPELQEGVLITMRAALLSAVNTLNELIADNEVRNYEAYRTATTDVRTRTKQPMQYTEAELEEVTVPPAAETTTTTQESVQYTGNDGNSQFLDLVYQKLKNAAGDGKMGLKKDLSPAEAQDLADDIAEMRAMLVDELQNGIPKEGSSDNSSSSASTNTSRYQEMLAKARKDKE